MTDVACFCGCLYSFAGSAGTCPRCGKCAIIRTSSPARGERRPQLAEPAVGAQNDTELNLVDWEMITHIPAGTVRTFVARDMQSLRSSPGRG